MPGKLSIFFGRSIDNIDHYTLREYDAICMAISWEK